MASGKDTPTSRDAMANRDSVTDKQVRLMVDGVKDYAIFLLDREGLVLSWNAGAERIKGYRTEEIIGKHFSIFYTAEEVKAGKPRLELDAAQAHGSMKTEGWRLRKDGSRFWADITITALSDDEGKFFGFSKVTRDATERREMEEALAQSRKMFERLFESAPDAILVVDGTGMIRKANRQLEMLFGYMREEIIGRQVEMLLPERFQKIHRQHRASYFADPRTRKMGVGLELFGRTRDGGEIPLDIMLSPIETDEGTWAFAAIRDITQRKENEAKITALNTMLQEQVEQMAATNRELEAFSFSVSHDLRAPLRHIIGFIELLNEGDLSCLDATSRHYLQVVSDAARKMGVLIDDLLAFSRMGRVEMMKTRVDLNQLINEIRNELAEEMKGRDISWEIAPLPEVVGDPAMLHQVMVNLIANALKFTRPRPQTRIEIGALADNPKEILFYVKDNGVGFDMKYENKLFGLFQRLHKPEDFEGTGVGLAHAQRVIHRHGGRIWAESIPGEGATFWFSLPETEEGRLP